MPLSPPSGSHKLSPADILRSPGTWLKLSRSEALSCMREHRIAIVYPGPGGLQAGWFTPGSPYHSAVSPYAMGDCKYFLLAGAMPVMSPGGLGKVKPPPKPPAPEDPPEPLEPEEEVKPSLVITKVDEKFAPGKENQDICYTITGLKAKPVTITITGTHHPDGPVFEKELEAGEKSDGTHVFHWDGKSTATAGPLKGLSANPLHSPYKVKIAGGGQDSGEKEFRILYHSIALKQGPWTPDEKEPPEAEEKAWVQYKLNELGFFGGPVGKDTDKYLEKAIIRYKANHSTMHRTKYSKYDGKITAELKEALKKGENKREWFDGKAIADTAAVSHLRVEAMNYEDGEFGTTNKTTKEKQRMNRPLIPLEAEIMLTGKAGKPCAAPDGVGPVRVNWRFTDPPEDTSIQFPDEPANKGFPKKYLEKALKVKGGAANDNCHVDYGGIRVHPKTDFGPFMIGEFYLPHKVEADKAQKLVFSKACIDKDKAPLRVGKAGVYFRPSNIAGDDYILRAELDFTGLPNKADLEKDHKVTDEKSRIGADTGKFHIQRFHRLAVVIKWPGRTGSSEWTEISDEFAKAHLDFNTASLLNKPVADVMSEAEYQAIVMKHTKHKTKAKIAYHADAVVGVDLPKQKKMKAGAYRNALRTFVSDNYWDRIFEAVRKKFSENLRKEFPVGVIVLEFLNHKPVNIETDPKKGDHTVTPANTGYVTWSTSYGMPDSTVLIDQMDPDRTYYVVGHEIGHSFWLLHAENTGESNGPHHDSKDHNCIMSYSDSDFKLKGHHKHQEPKVFAPHFCGKCNIRLRGWDLAGKGLPGGS